MNSKQIALNSACFLSEIYEKFASAAAAAARAGGELLIKAYFCNTNLTKFMQLGSRGQGVGWFFG